MSPSPGSPSGTTWAIASSISTRSRGNSMASNWFDLKTYSSECGTSSWRNSERDWRISASSLCCSSSRFVSCSGDSSKSLLVSSCFLFSFSSSCLWLLMTRCFSRLNSTFRRASWESACMSSPTSSILTSSSIEVSERENLLLSRRSMKDSPIPVSSKRSIPTNLNVVP